MPTPRSKSQLKPRPRLAISMGDPAGIGPEVIVKAVALDRAKRAYVPMVLGDPEVLRQAARSAHVKLNIQVIPDPRQTGQNKADLLVFTSPELKLKVKPGKWSQHTGRVSFAAVVAGTRMVQKHLADALVTAPISKQAWHAAGKRFSGHTELLGSMTHSHHYAMMFVNGPFRLVLATIHEPLSRVKRLLTKQRLVEVMRVAIRELRDRFQVKRPKVAVAGLNPHAGEGGLFGQEEKTVILPAMSLVQRSETCDLVGPIAPDTLFVDAVQGSYDLVVCMYHDQGLIPFKLLALHQGVNLTAGLPIIRTSPDHGTAFDLAGKGIADPGSMRAALSLAADLVVRTQGRR